MSALINKLKSPRFIDSEVLLLSFVLLMMTAGFVSIAISQICLGASLFLMLYRWGVKKIPMPRTGLELSAVLLAFWALINIPFSTDIPTSMVFYRRFFLFSTIWVVASVINSEKRRLLFLLFTMLGALAISVYGEVRLIAETGALFGHRLGVMSNPMTSGSLLMMAFLMGLGILLSAGINRRLKIGLGLVLIPILLGVVLTMTRSALLGVIGGTGMMVLLAHRRWFAGFAIILALGVGLLFTVGESVLPANLYDRVNPEYLVSGTNTTARLEMWAGGWEMVKARPLLGFGDRSLDTLAPDYYGDSDTVYHGHLHNNFVQLAVIWGIPGLLLGVFFIVQPLVLLVRSLSASHPPLLGAWILGGTGVWTGFFLAGFTEWYFGDAETMLIYLAFSGCALVPCWKGQEQTV